MKVLGVVCEYNPFHNGHALQLQRARQETQADFAVCVMSGAFAQRGEPAMTDKWNRARCALLHGADLVIELPTPHALGAAPDFARGAVGLLAALGVVTHLGFGSEVPLEELQKAAEGAEDSARVREALSRGESYPRAMQSSRASSLPNATLGLEYLRAMKGTPLIPHVTLREVPHDGDTLGEVASASAIRAAVRAGLPANRSMPPDAALLLEESLNAQGGAARWELLFPTLLHVLRTTPADALAALYGMGEGLHNRLIRAAKEARSAQELFDLVKCKRYTMARIRRAAACALLGIPAALAQESSRNARVLGLRKSAQPLLRAIKERGGLPLVTKLPRTLDDPLLAASLRTQEMWALACPRPMPAGMDYRESIVLLP